MTIEKMKLIFTIMLIILSSCLNKEKYNGYYAAAYGEKYSDIVKFAHEDSLYFKRYNLNCTNFVSQCILAGFTKSIEMRELKKNINKFRDTEGPYKWYYKGKTDGAGEWTYSDSLYNYAIHNKEGKGGRFKRVLIDYPFKKANLSRTELGDIVFMDFENDGFIDHTMLLTSKVLEGNDYDKILVSGHTNFLLNKPLNMIREKYDSVVFHIYRPIEFYF